MQVIRAKDLEIFDFEQSGAVLTRKSLKTETFDPKVLDTVSAPTSSSVGEVLCSEDYKDVQIRTIADKSAVSKSTPTKDVGSEKARRKRIRIRGREDLYGGSDDDDDDEKEGTAAATSSSSSSPAKAPKVIPKANKKVAKKLRKL